MGLEGWVYLYHTITPPPNLGHSWVIFEGWSQILPSTKLFRHGLEQSCSAMATQMLEEKVQQHDEVVESSKTGCRSQSGARITKTFDSEEFKACVFTMAKQFRGESPFQTLRFPMKIISDHSNRCARMYDLMK